MSETEPPSLKGKRVHSNDYGDGTVVLDLGPRVQVVWDEPLVGTTDHHALLHDRPYVLERLAD